MNDRSKFIGGSDIACILGIGFSSPLELFLRKTGQAEDKPSLMMALGHTAEPVILDRYEAETGRTLERNVRLLDPAVPYFAGTADGISHADGYGVDAKLTRTGVWDSVPAYYCTQAQWYMSLSGLDRWDFAVAHILGDVETVKIYTVERDDITIDYIRQKAHEFWDAIQTNTPPMPISITEVGVYFDLVQWEKKERIDLEGTASELYRIFVEKKLALKELEKDVAGLKTVIVSMLGPADTYYMDGKKAITRTRGSGSYRFHAE